MQHSLYNVPEELRVLNQWVCCKSNKNLFQTNGWQAKVNDSATWNTFEACVAAIGTNDIVSAGFVLTEVDPYFIIDLDKTYSDEKRIPVHLSIERHFDTFSEISISGTGCHIIGKGSLDGINGFKNKEWGVECYSADHYLVFTGNVHSTKPIAERQDLLNNLQRSFAKEKIKQESNITPSLIASDAEIIAKICSASNGEKFKNYYSNGYSSNDDRSSVDISFMNFLAFYNVSTEQAVRIMRSSALAMMRSNGPKDKSKKFDRPNYLIDTYNNALANPIIPMPSIDFSGISKFEIAPIVTMPTDTSISIPPGLMGDIARFIYEAAPRPVPEIAIAGAIGLMAGVCGSAYNTHTGTGLNQYIICLAGTGVGKDAAASGIDKLVNEVNKINPSNISSNFIGPTEIASGQALAKYIATKSKCFVSILGEFGLKLKMMSDPKASSADNTLRRTLLQIYMRSGHGLNMGSSIFADSDKNTSVVMSPALSILAESTPETVYESINEKMITDGLVPRFIIINYTGKRQLLSETYEKAIPSVELVSNLASLMAHCTSLMESKKVIIVEINADVKKLLRDYDKVTTDKINNRDLNNKAVKELWSRAHLKILKLAGLVAVGVNMNDPVMTKEMYIWAKDIVETSIHILSKKFETGETGNSSNELRQIYDLKRIIKQYISSPFSRYEKLGYVTKKMHSKNVFPHKFLSQRTGSLTSYSDELGRGRATEYLGKVIKVMIDNSELIEVNKMDMRKEFDNDQKAYMVTDLSVINDVDAEG